MKIRELFGNADRPAIEKWCRAQTQVAYLGDNRALCRVLGAFLMYVDARDLSLAPHLMMDGFWEMWVTQAIVDYVKPGMTCIDVGANVGYFTLLLGELVGDKGEVIGYEPMMELVALLKDSITVNGSVAQVLPRAASDHSGFQKFYGVSGFAGSGSLNEFPGSRVIATAKQKEVCLSRIDDDFAGRIPTVHFVKIDVQGHEFQVLAGMKETIAQSPGIAIAMEFTPSEHENPAEAIDTIVRMGLRIQAIGTDGQVRPITLEDAARADTGDHRMLWLTRGDSGD